MKPSPARILTSTSVSALVVYAGVAESFEVGVLVGLATIAGLVSMLVFILGEGDR